MCPRTAALTRQTRPSEGQLRGEKKIVIYSIAKQLFGGKARVTNL